MSTKTNTRPAARAKAPKKPRFSARKGDLLQRTRRDLGDAFLRRLLRLRDESETGAVLWKGASLLDGAPLVVLGIRTSTNTKTGDMVQTYILRADVDPVAASGLGLDFSICGACPHRGQSHGDGTRSAAGRSCYVNFRSVVQVYKSFVAGQYPDARTPEKLADFAAGRLVRLGTYGDPAAVPSGVWRALLKNAAGHTAYTHQSGAPGADVDDALFMRSADTADQARAAWAEGARTFRVLRDVAELDKAREVLCPASEEAGRRTTCAACKLCGGAAIRAKSVAIVAHGPGAAAFKLGGADA